MSGHNKWSQIKDKKAKTDQGRAQLFSKLANAISIAARGNPDPKFNATLRGAVDQARKHNMPQANIERAIHRGAEVGDLEELLIEAYGPEGVGILIEAITDNRNRTVPEIRLILKEHDVRVAEPGALMWSFEKNDGGYTPKFNNPVSASAIETIDRLIISLENHPDVKEIYTSIKQ
ncbi:MAG: YebC/PmpR family DNA-binding transcriptional regulator [Candidatus Colwellbacteria bacterium]|nr:YebC/PmpR family DNA-binding transcriptional regulator [Candidatus Colwellbacteria bacterium]